MAEDFEDDIEDSEMESILNQYCSIKKTGTKCKVPEALKFYTQVLDELKDKAITGMSYYMENMDQKIPYKKLEKEDLELIVGDGDFMQENISIFNLFLQYVWDVSKNPKKYNAWKGEIEMTVGEISEVVLNNADLNHDEKLAKVKEKQMAYYIELKKNDEDEKVNGEMLYI